MNFRSEALYAHKAKPFGPTTPQAQDPQLMNPCKFRTTYALDPEPDILNRGQEMLHTAVAPSPNNGTLEPDPELLLLEDSPPFTRVPT